MVARELMDAGHSVVGLVRSKEKGESLAASGGTPLVGSLADLDLLQKGAEEADGIVHTAFGLDFSKIAELSEEEKRMMETFGAVFAGSRRPIVATSGIGLTSSGEIFTEEERPAVVPEFPRTSEQTAFSLADRGLHVSVVRLPRSVHGVGETHGFVPMLAAAAREKGVSAYVGDGVNLWPSVYRVDAARVFRLALERGAQGEAFHAVAEEGLPFREIAEAIGRQVGVPTRSLSAEEADAHFGGLARWVAGSGPASAAWTRSVLGWEPREIGLIPDIDRPEYHA